MIRDKTSFHKPALRVGHMRSSDVGQTPANLYQLEQQKKNIEYLRGTVSPSVVNEAIKKMMKGAEITMQNSLLLQQQIH